MRIHSFCSSCFRVSLAKEKERERERKVKSVQSSLKRIIEEERESKKHVSIQWRRICSTDKSKPDLSNATKVNFNFVNTEKEVLSKNIFFKGSVLIGIDDCNNYEENPVHYSRFPSSFRFSSFDQFVDWWNDYSTRPYFRIDVNRMNEGIGVFSNTF